MINRDRYYEISIAVRSLEKNFSSLNQQAEPTKPCIS